MRLTTLTKIGVASVLAVSGLVVAPAAQAAPELSPGLVSAMRTAFGLTEQQALTRLDQEAKATRRAPSARTAAGSSFGGSWFDADRGVLVVGVTDEAAADRVRATGAEARLVTRTAAELDRLKDRVDALSAAGAVPAAVTSWHPDPRRGAVVVDVQPGVQTAEVARFLAEARKSGPVEVNTKGVTAPVPFAAGTVGGDPYYTGNVRCSIGFSVHGGYVTAGHCGGTGAQVYGWDRSWQGQFAGSSFPGNDYAWVRTGGGWWNVPVVLGWGTVPDALVRGSWEAPVGTSVCRSGSTTRWHCGVIQSRNETIHYAQGDVHQMAGTSVCAEGGDSGGSFITGDQAQGVTSGGYGNCSSGGRTWFQPINEILSVYGLRLLTA
ncbi:S1 family peptidase [Saccharothrix carnea]|uniref:S1 family peptidase n=1 Tax=Saccharothrix TaxID=2071 RepID=UPI00093B0F9A|nr:peptidase S1 [Saccharothrix sp. CB00851]